MAYETDTAAGHLNLLARIATKAVAEGWTELESSPGVRVLQSPALTDYGSPIVALETVQDAVNDWHNLRWTGLHSWTDGVAISQQALASSPVYLQLWDADLPYWLVVSDRRIALAVKVSTVYQAGYFGLIQPYGLPSQWAYPLLVAGTSGTAGQRWSETGDTHRMPWASKGGAYLWSPNGVWVPINQGSTSGVANINPTKDNVTWMRRTVAGNTPLWPLTLYQDDSTVENVYGTLEGLFWVPGDGLGAESLVEISTDDYLALPDVYRAGHGDFAVLKEA